MGAVCICKYSEIYPVSAYSQYSSTCYKCCCCIFHRRHPTKYSTGLFSVYH